MMTDEEVGLTMVGEDGVERPFTGSVHPPMSEVEIDQAVREWSRRPTWELRNIQRALNTFTWENTHEDRVRLRAVTRILHDRRQARQAHNDRRHKVKINTYNDSSGGAHTYFKNDVATTGDDAYPMVYVSVDENNKRRVTVYTGDRDDVVVEVDGTEVKS
jgi:hypothetical protein